MSGGGINYSKWDKMTLNDSSEEEEEEDNHYSGAGRDDEEMNDEERGGGPSAPPGKPTPSPSPALRVLERGSSVTIGPNGVVVSKGGEAKVVQGQSAPTPSAQQKSVDSNTGRSTSSAASTTLLPWTPEDEKIWQKLTRNGTAVLPRVFGTGHLSNLAPSSPSTTPNAPVQHYLLAQTKDSATISFILGYWEQAPQHQQQQGSCSTTSDPGAVTIGGPSPSPSSSSSSKQQQQYYPFPSRTVQSLSFPTPTTLRLECLGAELERQWSTPPSSIAPPTLPSTGQASAKVGPLGWKFSLLPTGEDLLSKQMQDFVTQASSSSGSSSSRRVCRAEVELRYPVDESMTLADHDADWELLTVKVPTTSQRSQESSVGSGQGLGFLRVLKVECKKTTIGAGVYLWWDRLLKAEQEATVDTVRGIEGRRCESTAPGDAGDSSSSQSNYSSASGSVADKNRQFRENWLAAEAAFGKKLAEGTLPEPSQGIDNGECDDD
jgi:hypothetical protein